MSAVTSQNFYEDDEPAEDIFAVFHAGEKLRTKQPTRGETQYLYFDGTRPGDAVVTTVRAVLRGDRLPVGSNL